MFMRLCRPTYRVLKSILRDEKIIIQSRALMCSQLHHNEEDFPAQPVTNFQRVIPRTNEEKEKLKNLLLKKPEDQKCLKVAIIGSPNAGKSTLANKLMNWRVFSTSSKVHTTLKNSSGVYIDDNVQLVLLDTPGVVNKQESTKYNLKKSFVSGPAKAVLNADLIVVLVDVANQWTSGRIDRNILPLIENCNKKTILVLNKVDQVQDKKKLLNLADILTVNTVGGAKINKIFPTVPKSKSEFLDELMKRTEKLLAYKGGSAEIDNESSEITNSSRDSRLPSKLLYDEYSSPEIDKARASRGWKNFERIFMVSALDGDGIEELRDYIIDEAYPAPWKFPPQQVTDQSAHDIAIMALREKLLDYMPNEVPYTTPVHIELWEVSNTGVLCIAMAIESSSRRASLLIGPKGATIKRISDGTKQVLMNTFRCELNLRIIVTIKKK